LPPPLAAGERESDISRLSTGQVAAYAGINVPTAILHAPVLSVLPGLYAKYSHIPLTLLGTILVATRILDAVIDPFIGYLSDRTQSRFGRRKPWIVAGAAVSILATYFSFRPSGTTGALYFLIWSTLLYVGWTLIEIPHTAWINDVTNDYDDRSRIVTYRYLAGLIGYALFLAVPLLPIFATTEMTPSAIALTGWILIALLPLTIAFAFRRVPVRGDETPASGSWRSTWNELRNNRPLWSYLALRAANGLSTGMIASLYFFYLDRYLGLLSRFSYLNLSAMAFGFIGSSVWLGVMYRIGKHRALAASSCAVILTLVAFALMKPGAYAFPIALVVWMASSLGNTGVETASYALLSDVADYGTLKSGESRAGNYWALQAFMQKVTIAAGGGLALIIIGLFGFDPSGANGPAAMRGFFLTFIFIPMALNLLAVILAWYFPIDRRRHDVIRRRIEARKNRQERLAEPLTLPIRASVSP
jgi:GPH family glycoside/pentoside/hexuronide:cation symporter